MRATMEAAPGVGLAAPQVGVALQLAVLRDGPQRWGQLTPDERAARERTELPFTVLVNPVLQPVDADDLVSFCEGCLSVPGLTAVVARLYLDRAEARSLSTAGNYAQRWAGRPPADAAMALGFRLS
jgi:peptide deformylase